MPFLDHKHKFPMCCTSAVMASLFTNNHLIYLEFIELKGVKHAVILCLFLSDGIQFCQTVHLLYIFFLLIWNATFIAYFISMCMCLSLISHLCKLFHWRSHLSTILLYDMFLPPRRAGLPQSSSFLRDVIFALLCYHVMWTLGL